MIAKLEIINPIIVFVTPKVRAKIGMAGIIKPKPTATRNEIAVRTVTSIGSPRKRFLRILIPEPLRWHLGEHSHVRCYLEVASLLRRLQRKIQEQQLAQQR